MKQYALSVALVVAGSTAFADGHGAAPSGDAALGAEVFQRQCVACHVVVNGAGETLAGRNARTGPNLYGISQRGIGGAEGFNYSEGVVALRDQGAMWNEADFSAYVQDPTGWLREATGDRRARARMSFQLRNEADALNVYAYLVSLEE